MVWCASWDAREQMTDGLDDVEEGKRRDEQAPSLWSPSATKRAVVVELQCHTKSRRSTAGLYWALQRRLSHPKISDLLFDALISELGRDL